MSEMKWKNVQNCHIGFSVAFRTKIDSAAVWKITCQSFKQEKMVLSCLVQWSVIKHCKSVNLTVVACMHNCARFFVEIASELYFSILNYRETAKILKISLCSVYTAIRIYLETGQNTNWKQSGRPRKTNQRFDNKIYTISKGNRQKSASEIRAEINEDLDSPISLKTVNGRLKEKGMIGRIAVRNPLLRPVNKQKRLKFAKEHVDWTIDQWKSVLWIDESKFELFGSHRRQYVGRKVNERLKPDYIVPTVKHGGGSVMV